MKSVRETYGDEAAFAVVSTGILRHESGAVEDE